MSRTETQPGRVRLRPTEAGDLAGLAELFRDRFGHPIPPEEWDWKYRRLPGEGRSWVALDGAGRIVAHAGALRLPARLRLAAAGADAAPPGAEPGWLDRGIWQLTDWAGSAGGAGLRPPLVALGRRLLEGLPAPGDAPWIFGFPSARHFRLGERAFGYRPLPAIMPLVGELAAAAGSGAGMRLEVSDRCDDRAEAAWRACGVPSVRRSAAFLNWRYYERPGRYYRFYQLPVSGAVAAGGGPGSPEGARAEGLAVFAFVGRLARGAELWLPGAGDPLRAWGPSLRAVARNLAAAGLERWELWPPPGSGLEPLLRELGLRPEGETVFMGCRGGAAAGPVPVAPGFYYSMGDWDLV